MIVFSGCVERGRMWVKETYSNLVKMVIGVGVIELLGILCAMGLWYSFGNESKGKRIT